MLLELKPEVLSTMVIGTAELSRSCAKGQFPCDPANDVRALGDDALFPWSSLFNPAPPPRPHGMLKWVLGS